MNILSLDTETSIFNKGNAFDSRNKLVCFSWATEFGSGAQQWDMYIAPQNAQIYVDESNLIVGFNFKFDLHWLIKNGVYQLRQKQIWDVQIAEFILSNQTWRFPSLNETCEKYGIPKKKDVVKEEYWEKGISTEDIPWEILSEYAEHDAVITLQCYYEQRKLMTPVQVKLCYLMCQDLQILQEMEMNGLPFDENLCNTRSLEVDDQISTHKTALANIYPNIALNFGSNDQLSAFLYGGVVTEESKEHVGFFKTGERKGQPKYKNITIEHILPRLYEPLKGTEMQKEGVFATDEGTLRKLKGKKGVIQQILELSKLEKLNGTYYKGLVKLRKEKHWPEGLLHGSFNQTTAQTGRLSSSAPNLQNMASDIQDIFISLYKD